MRYTILQRPRFWFINLFISFSIYLPAQNCVADYFSISYKGQYNQIISSSIQSFKKEILNTGSVNYSDQLPMNTYYFDGWVAKFTPNGSNLFSKKYNIPTHNHTEFNTIIASSDSTYLLSGNCGYTAPFDSAKISKSAWGSLLLLDSYGNVIWNKLLNGGLQQSVNRSFINHVSVARDGDIIISASIQKNYNDPSFVASGLIVRMSPHGVIRWKTFINANGFNFDGGSAKNMQLANGNIITGGYVYNFPNYNKYGYYFICIDYSNGNALWQKMYLQKQLAIGPTSGLIGNSFSSIKELSNGQLSFQLHIKDTTGSGFNHPYGSKSINFLTDAKGKMISALAYTDTQTGTYTSDVAFSRSNTQILAIDDGQSSLVTEISEDGIILNSKSYSANPTMIPSSIISTQDGNYLLLTDRGPYGGKSYMIKSDTSGNNICKVKPISVNSKDMSNNFIEEIPPWNITSSTAAGSEYASVSFTNYPISVSDYPLVNSNECNKACCQDIIDTSRSKEVSICESETYRLADNHLVKDSGIYYARLYSVKGCDSIVFVNLRLIKSPQLLSLGSDTCLTIADSLILHTTPGFSSYLWNNTLSANSFYTVKQPGIYTVSVNNQCGTKTVQIMVYAECDFPVFIPNSFTPNADNLNDVFRIPPSQLIKNHFIELKIFNRWGQLIFETTDPNKAWDGRCKSFLQPTGKYIYRFVLQSLSGKIYTKTGEVMLIR